MGNLFQQNRKYFLLGFVLFLYALVITPLLIINLQKQQDLRGRAQVVTSPTPAFDVTALTTPQQGVCSSGPADTVLIMDRSGSMSGSKIAAAKTAAKTFVDKASVNTNNRIALVVYDDKSQLVLSFTSDFAAVKSKIDSISVGGGTCIVCGVNKANTEISTKGRAGIKKAAILLSDGRANYIEGKSASTSTAEAATITSVQSGFNTNKTTFFTIGLGSSVSTSFLQQIADITGGKYYFSPTEAQLTTIYTDISQVIGKGSVQGRVFNDANGNGVQDAGETNLSGWVVTLLGPNDNSASTYTSDTIGVFTAANLCDGQYKLKLTLQAGWKQTLPTDINGYTFSITSGSILDNKNFGVKQVTRCNDGVDNDNNGYTDTNDSSCHTDGNPKNPSSYDPNKNGENGGGNTCADSKDNNGNNLIDGGDPVCHTDGDPTKPYDPDLPEVTRCNDTKDNDDNGFADINDSSCHSDGNPKNPTSYLPTKEGENGGGGTCADSKDNNGNGLIDGGDPVCHTDGDPTKPYDPTRPEDPLTNLTLTVLLDGIGSRGDNTNPTASSFSNKNPLHKTKEAEVSIFNASNQLIATVPGNVTFNSTNGNFTGTLTTDKLSTSGNYLVRIKINGYLRKLVDGIQNLTAGQTNQIPTTALVTGDINRDNKIDILDYNLLLDCYSDLAVAPNCANPTKKAESDINDDGLVNQFDYNLFLREISTQPGE